jgi:hypothetical protein
MLNDVTTPRNVEKIREYFGEEAESIIENLEMERLLEIPGFGRKTAQEILMRSYERKTGEKFEEVLYGDAGKVYEKIIAYFQEYPVTTIAKNKFFVQFPTSNRSLIEKRLAFCDRAKSFVEGLGEERAERLIQSLRGLRNLVEPEAEKIHDRVIVVDSEELLERVANPYCDVLLIETGEDIQTAQSYNLIFYVYTKGSDRYEKIAEVSDYEIHEGDFELEIVVPESKIERFYVNRKTLATLCEISRILGGDETLEEIVTSLEEKGEEGISESQFDEIVSREEGEINRMFEVRIKDEKMALGGREILNVLEGIHKDPESAIRSYLPKSVETLYYDLTREAHRRVSEAVGFDVELFSDELAFPIEVIPEKLEEAREELVKRKTKSLHLSKKNLLSLARHWEHVRKKEGEAYETDFMVAVGRILLKHHMICPQLGEGGTSFVGGHNLFIPHYIPVDYKVGETPHDFVGNDNVVVLTGANSGGKTTLLETMLQNQILAQMGFFVPCQEFYTAPYSEIHYLTKPRAQDAGAFESSLRSLVPLALTEKKKLVLIDELEAITEPGSAAKIISSFLNLLRQNRNTVAVIVSHLGEEIMKHTDARSDGIEAQGLTDALELEVNRQPIFHRLGRSTPELIVEKLSKRSAGKEKEVYQKMLEDLRG